MNRNRIEEKTLDILREQTGDYEGIQLDTKLQDEAGFDSLDKLEVCMKLEKAFAISVDNDFLFSEAVGSPDMRLQTVLSVPLPARITDGQIVVAYVPAGSVLSGWRRNGSRQMRSWLLCTALFCSS